MNGTTLERPDVAAYLDAVRSCLADLPAEERDDLVADVEASLLESGEPPAFSPQEFAAELRDAAGLAPPGPARTAPVSLRASVRAWLADERVAAAVRNARALMPIWWVARAYAAVAGAALALDAGWPLDNGGLPASTLLFLAVTAASIWLGLRQTRYRRLASAVNVALVLALVPVLSHSLDVARPQLVYQSFPTPSPAVPGLTLDGKQILNIYAYDREGVPLFDVLLYDESGIPINVLSGRDDMSRRILTDVNGVQIFNSFPIRYYDPGTKTVERPRLAPPIAIPEVATPPLRGTQR